MVLGQVGHSGVDTSRSGDYFVRAEAKKSEWRAAKLLLAERDFLLAKKEEGTLTPGEESKLNGVLTRIRNEHTENRILELEQELRTMGIEVASDEFMS